MNSNKIIKQPSFEQQNKLYNLLRIPNISTGYLFQSQDQKYKTFQVTTAQKDLKNKKARKYIQNYLVHQNVEHNISKIGTTQEVGSEVIFMQPSPSGRKCFNICKNDSAKDQFIVQIIVDGGEMFSLPVSLNFHGSIYNEGLFGQGAIWDENEEQVAYVAEQPTPTNPKYMLNKDQQTDQSQASQTLDVIEMKPFDIDGIAQTQGDWGENYSPKKPPTIYVLNIRNQNIQSISKLKGLPEDYSFGQPQFTPEGNILFVGWPHLNESLKTLKKFPGFIYCQNRESYIYQGSFRENQVQKLFSQYQALSNPRFSPNGDTLVMLSNQRQLETCTHAGQSQLLACSWSDKDNQKDVKVVVPLIDYPQGGLPQKSFPGLFLYSLPSKCFLDNEWIVVSSSCYGSIELLKIHITSQQCDYLQFSTQKNGPCQEGYKQVLFADKGYVLVSYQTLNEAPSLHIGQQVPQESSNQLKIQWKKLDYDPYQCFAKQQTIVDDIGNVSYKYLYIDIDGGDIQQVQAIIMGQKDCIDNKKARPTILMPHGGPHASHHNMFIPQYSHLVNLGVNLLLVNFRGSFGFGLKYLESLPGHIGDYDVKDCMSALEAATKQGYVDKQQIGVMGGSHGGFLTGHLIGQYPDVFKFGIARNPVFNIALMVYISDIPEWCFVEAYGIQAAQKEFLYPPSIENLQRFMEVSPIRYVHQVQAKLYLMLGKKDQRVPMQDALSYANALRAKTGYEANVWIHEDDNHPLDKLNTLFQNYIDISSIFLHHFDFN